MSKHTPGPWYAGSDEDCNIVYDAHGGFVAETTRDDGDADQETANAEIVAAAPELLAACQEIAKQANMGIDAEYPDDWYVAEIRRSAIEAVRAAIAKAIGGEVP